MKRNFLKNKGFTLVETLVAIAILMIAIAGPLTTANKAYTSALDARNENIAFFLAQDALEYANSVKDSTSSFTYLSSCTSQNPCAISPVRNSDIPMTPFSNINLNVLSCDSANNCNMTYRNDTGYSYINRSGNGFEVTPFRRIFYLTSSGGLTDEYMATVVVSWNTGNLSGSVELNQLLTNYPRGL